MTLGPGGENWQLIIQNYRRSHRYLKKIRLLKFCYVPATSAASSKCILHWPPTVLAGQTSQVARAINQSIFLGYLWLYKNRLEHGILKGEASLYL